MANLKASPDSRNIEIDSTNCGRNGNIALKGIIDEGQCDSLEFRLTFSHGRSTNNNKYDNTNCYYRYYVV